MLRRVNETLDKAADEAAGKSKDQSHNKGALHEKLEKLKAEERKKTKKNAKASYGSENGSNSESDPDSDSDSKSAASSKFVTEYIPSFWRLVDTNNTVVVSNFLSTGFPHLDGREPQIGNTVLFHVIKKGWVKMTETLLRFGASTSIQNEMGDSPIHYCWRFWERDDVEKNTPVILTDDKIANATALKAKYQIMEDRRGREVDQNHRTTELLKLLLMNGADPNVRDGGGGVPLHDAARRGPVQAVKALLQFSADSSVKNDGNQTPMYLAKLQNQTECAKLLQHWGALEKPHEKNEFMAEWKSFLDDVDIPITLPTPSAKRVLDDLMIEEHQQTLIRWKRSGLPVVDEIVSGPLSVPLAATTTVGAGKLEKMKAKKGR